MENNSNRIDAYFRKRLTGFEQAPPDAVWDTLAQKLGHRKNKGMALLIFRIAAGMALLISTGIGIYVLTNAREETRFIAQPVGRQDTKQGKSAGLAVQSKKLPAAIPEKSRQGLLKSAPEKTLPAEPSIGRNDQYEVLTTIAASRKPRMLKSTLPGNMFPVDVRESKTYTEEKALALLMSDYTEPETFQDNVKHWVVGSEVAPLYSDRSIASDDMNTDVLDNLNEHESGMLAYAGGIRVAYATGRRLSVQSGIYYARYGQEKSQVRSYGNKNAAATIEGSKASSYIAVTNSTGTINSKEAGNAGYDMVMSGNGGITADIESYYENFNYSDQMSSIPDQTNLTLSQVFDYLELPLVLRYKVIDRKFDFSFQGGLITNFLVGNSVNLIEDGKTTRIGETTNINQVNYQGSLGMGFEYPVASNFALTLEPRFRYYINPIDKSSRIDVHPFSFGIFAGISYLF